MVSATTGAAARAQGRTFYVAMGLLTALIAVIGFSQRYFIPMADGTLQETAIVHVHAVVMFGWMAMLILQTGLVATGRSALHRSVGLAGVALATLVVFTAAQIAILQLARELETGRPPLGRDFVVYPLSNAVLVLGLFAVGFAHVNRPETHKRLMLTATFVILGPAFARITQMIINVFPPDRILTASIGGLASDALILLAMAYDWRTRGRPHPAYLIAGAGIAAVQAVRALVHSTPWWRAAADSLAGLAG